MEPQQPSAFENENINRKQIAADLSVVQQRKRLKDSQECRVNLLENKGKLNLEKFDEFLRDFEKFEKKLTCMEQRELFRNQKQLCITMLQDKQDLIKDLQQMLRLKDEQFVKNLRKNAEDVDLMIKESEDQIETTIKACRDDLTNAEMDHQLEMKSLFSYAMTKQEEDMKAHQDNEFQRCLEARKKFVDSVEEDLKLRLQLAYDEKARLLELILKKQALAAESQQHKGTAVADTLLIAQRKEEQKLWCNHKERKRMLKRNQAEMLKLKAVYAKQQKEATERNRILSEKIKRKEEQNERRKELRKNAVIAHARKYKAMEQMIEEELTQLADRALHIDAEITRRVFGSSWPQMASLELPSPSQAQELVPNISQLHAQTEEEKMGAACSLEAENPVTEASGGSGPEWEFPSDLQKEEKKQLCEKTTQKPSTHGFHWESLGDVIPEEKRRLWRAAEKKLREHHAVLKDIRYLQHDNERLKERNAELKKQVQERLISTGEEKISSKKQQDHPSRQQRHEAPLDSRPGSTSSSLGSETTCWCLVGCTETFY